MPAATDAITATEAAVADWYSSEQHTQTQREKENSADANAGTGAGAAESYSCIRDDITYVQQWGT